MTTLAEFGGTSPVVPSTRRALVRGSAGMVASVGVAAVTAAAFWIAAARVYPRAHVGQAAALFTSVLFINYLSGMGLPVAVARYASDRSKAANALFSLGVAYTVMTSAVASLLYLLLVGPGATRALDSVGGVWGPLVFALIVAGTSVATLVDVRVVALRRSSLVVWRAGLVGAGRFAVLALGGSGRSPFFLFVASSAPAALSGLVGLGVVRRLGCSLRWWPRPPGLGAAFRYAWVNYVSTLAYHAPPLFIPVIVLNSVSPATNANFYVAWAVTSVVCLVSEAIGQVLLVEGDRDGADLSHQARLALLLAVGAAIIATVGAFVGRPLVVTAYGAGYREAARLMPLFLLAAVPWAVTSIALFEARARHQSMPSVLIPAVLAVATVGPAAFLVQVDGLDGVVTGWLWGNVVAVVAAAAAVLRYRSPAVTAAEELVPTPVLAPATSASSSS